MSEGILLSSCANPCGIAEKLCEKMKTKHKRKTRYFFVIASFFQVTKIMIECSFVHLLMHLILFKKVRAIKNLSTTNQRSNYHKKREPGEPALTMTLILLGTYRRSSSRISLISPADTLLARLNPESVIPNLPPEGPVCGRSSFLSSHVT